MLSQHLSPGCWLRRIMGKPFPKFHKRNCQLMFAGININNEPILEVRSRQDSVAKPVEGSQKCKSTERDISNNIGTLQHLATYQIFPKDNEVILNGQRSKWLKVPNCWPSLEIHLFASDWGSLCVTSCQIIWSSKLDWFLIHVACWILQNYTIPKKLPIVVPY